MAGPIRIANCSGFLGDRMSGAREMVEGGPIDVLTGDYLAELTMAILARHRMKDPDAGYATTFLTQMEETLGSCLDRGIRVVANAGGLNPLGLAAKLEELADRLGLTVRVASVSGDDLMPRLGNLDVDLRNTATGESLEERGLQAITANAYLGGWGVCDALARGADVVVTGRISDASLVVGPAAWWHEWKKDAWDALAGAVVAGHVIECSAQATGGNYSFFAEVPGLEHPGFPIAEVAEDGSTAITKHPGTGGLVSVGTVTAQLLYEIGGPRYLNPDVVARFDTIRLASDGPDRVMIQGVRGEPPPVTTKVAMTCLAGFRNTVTFILTGLDIEAKAKAAEDALFAALGGRDAFDRTEVQLLRTDQADPPSNEAAFAYLRVSAADADRDKVGRAFSNAAVELALSSYPGFTLTGPPGRESPLAVFWPSEVPLADVPQHVSLGGVTVDISLPRASPMKGHAPVVDSADQGSSEPAAATSSPGIPSADAPDEGVVEVPIGRLIGARSGDKGGDANLGVWVRSEAEYDWLASFLTAQRLRELLPEIDPHALRRYPLPNLLAINFLIEGFLGEGVSSSSKFNPQAKSLAEYFRARVVHLPERLLAV